MDRPLTILALSNIIGILIAYSLDIPILLLVLIIFISIIIYTYRLVKIKDNWIVIIFIFLIMGSIIMHINRQNPFETLANDRNKYIGTIVEVISMNEDYSSYIFDIDKKLTSNLNDDLNINKKARLTIIGGMKLGLGDYIMVDGVVKIPLDNTNPKLYNEKLNLLSKNIYAKLNVDDYSVEVFKKDKEIKYIIKEDFQNRVTNIFDSNMNARNSTIMKSIILGKSDILDEITLTKYRELGLAHIIAVSGSHIGIIAAFILFILSRIGIKREINAAITILLLYIYIFFINFGPSAIRAFIMYFLLIYSYLRHEPHDTLNTISASIMISLFINPFYLFDVGFQLSYMAILSIAVLYPRIRNLFYPREGNLVKGISSVLAVNIGLLPIQSYYFNEIYLLSLIANLVILPIASISIVIAFILIFSNYLYINLGFLFGLILNFLLNIQHFLSEAIYKIPLQMINISSPDLIIFIVYYLALILLLNTLDRRLLNDDIKKTIIYFFIFLTVIYSFSILDNKNVKISFIDVGQGDSILINSEERYYLMDTGGSLFESYNIGEFITLPFLQKNGIRELEGIFITHFDQDHCQGLQVIIDSIKVKNLFVSYVPEDIGLIKSIKNKNISIWVLKAGDMIKLSPHAKLDILWPNESENMYNTNNKSMVSILNYNGRKVLFTGDIEQEVETKLSNVLVDIDILKVAHHGSFTSSTIEFISTVKPEYSIISVGRNNFYGHPNKEVINRLEKVDSKIFRTDTMGLIDVELNKEQIVITPYKKDIVYDEYPLKFIWDNIIYIFIILIYLIISYIFIKTYINYIREDKYYELQ